MCEREKSVEDTLSSQKRMVGSELLSNRSHLSHRPDLHERVLGLDALKLGLEHDVLDVIVARIGDVRDGTARLRVHHDLVLDDSVLVHDTDDVAASDVRAHAQHARWLEVPLFAAAQRLAVDTARDVDALEELGDILEWTLNTVVDTVHDAWTELDR